MDIRQGETAEAHLDALIEKRDKARRAQEGDRPAHEMYAASVRAYDERQEIQRWWEWLRFHEGQIRRHTTTLEALIGRHRKEAERYAALLGVEPIDETIKRNGHKKGAA